MHVKLTAVLAILAALAAAAPHGGRQEALTSPAHLLLEENCTGPCHPTQMPRRTCPYAPGWDSIQVGKEWEDECWRCCDTNTAVSSSLIKSLHMTGASDKDCWRACLPVKVDCESGYESNFDGTCWTCCRIEEEQVALERIIDAAKVDVDTKTNDQGICWRVCFEKEAKCPEGWESKKMGEHCWTCCLKDQQEVSKVSKSLAATTPCIPMCFDAPPKQCLFGSHPQQLGENCWSCCGGSIRSVSATAIVFDEANTKAVSKTLALTGPACVPICYPAGPVAPMRCLFGYEPRMIEGCWTCCDPNQRANKASGSLKVSAKSVVVSKSLAVEGPPCVPVCHSAPVRCAYGYHTAMIEPGCWSCCKTLDLENVASGNMDLVMGDPGICWRACFPEEIQCPPSGHAKNIGGDCWTCCFGGDESIQMNTQSLIGQLDTSSTRLSLTGDPCLMLCLPEMPEQCGTNGYAKQIGSCWTCCLKMDAQSQETISSGDSKTYSLISHNLGKQMMSHDHICLPRCMFGEPKCAENMYPKQFGDCWTCCLKPQSDEDEYDRHITDVAAYPGLCLRACFPSADSCPPDFFPDPKSGDGCTLCCTKGSESASQTVAPVEQNKHTPSLDHVREVCLRACFPSANSCPKDFYPEPNHEGFCTICCTKIDEEARMAVSEL